MQKLFDLCKNLCYHKILKGEKMSEVLTQLKERNINMDGEEYYAVLGAYLNKIEELEGGVTADISPLLKNVDTREKDIEKELLKYTKNKVVEKVLSSSCSHDEKVALIHEEAVNLGCQRVYQETFSRCRKFGNVHEKIEAGKYNYGRGYEDYKMLMSIKNDENSLDSLIRMRAGNVSTPIEEIKRVVLENINAQENEFLKLQTNFIGRVVSYIVDEECRLVKSQETAEIS